MRTFTVKDLMIPIEEYPTILQQATLRDAVLALEKAQTKLDPSQYRHRAILVLDESGKVISKITMKNIMIALEPNYGKLEGMGVLIRSGYSPELIKSMLATNALWHKPLQLVCERASKQKVSDFIQPILDSEYIDENAILGEALHQLVVYPYHSLMVTRDDEVVGIVRLSDVFQKVCDEIKACES